MSEPAYTRTSWDELSDWPNPGLGDDHPWPSRSYLSLKVYNEPLGCTQFAFSIGLLNPGDTVEHHHHEAGEEVYVLLEGTSMIRIGDAVIEAHPLDAFRIPPPIDRSVYNHTDSTCRWLFIGAPIGQGHHD